MRMPANPKKPWLKQNLLTARKDWNRLPKWIRTLASHPKQDPS